MTALARKHLDRQLRMFPADTVARPPRGWIRGIRDALGMTAAQLAGRMGVSQPRVSDIERRESLDSLTLSTLRAAAEALDCTLVYALVPNRPLETMVQDRARAMAATLLARTHHSMQLENQGLREADYADELDRLTRELVNGDPRRLWDET